MINLPIPDSITPTWLTTVLRDAGTLSRGNVLSLTSEKTSAFNSATSRLQVSYSDDAPTHLATRLILKRNIDAQWAIQAGIDEVKFYQLAATLDPFPPAVLPCYAAAYDEASGNSYLVLPDLSETHHTYQHRDDPHEIPPQSAIDSVIDALAKHHAYWWEHPLLWEEHFAVGFWTRNAERMNAYLARRRRGWEDLLEKETEWFPKEYIDVYDAVFPRLFLYWEKYIAHRFRDHSHVTLVHGDSYFANILAVKPTTPVTSAAHAYLIDWQSPSVDIGGKDLANLLAAWWTSEQRLENDRELRILQHYHARLQHYGVRDYSWNKFFLDYQIGLIFWLLMPLQDRYDGAAKSYWWPKMQCVVAAFRDWECEKLLGI